MTSPAKMANDLYDSVVGTVYGKVSTDEEERKVEVEMAQSEDNGNLEGYGAIKEDLDDHLDTRFSFKIMAFIVLLGDSTRGLMFPTLWPLVHSLGGTKANQGIIVAAFSMGRVLVSPFYGSVSSNRGYRDVLIFAHLIVAGGALWYNCVTTLRGLLLAQICLGLGCGTLGVTRSYVAESVEKRDRTIYLGRLTAMQYCGFTCTPFLGSLMFHLGTKLDSEDFFSKNGFRIDPLSFPAFLIFIGSILAIFLLCVSFHDLTPEKRHQLQRHHEFKSVSREQLSTLNHAPLTNGNSTLTEAQVKRREDLCAIVGLLLNVITKGSIGCYETIGVIYASQNFNMPGPDVGYVVAVCGAVGVGFLLAFKQFSKYFDDVSLMFGGIAIMILSCLMLIDAIRPQFIYTHDLAKKTWATAIFLMYAVGYPIGHTAVIGWFSKAMGKRPQGFLMGIFASAGSVARVGFPIMTGFVAQKHGLDTVFIILAIMLTVTYFIILVFKSAFRHAIH